MLKEKPYAKTKKVTKTINSTIEQDNRLKTAIKLPIILKMVCLDNGNKHIEYQNAAISFFDRIVGSEGNKITESTSSKIIALLTLDIARNCVDFFATDIEELLNKDYNKKFILSNTSSYKKYLNYFSIKSSNSHLPEDFEYFITTLKNIVKDNFVKLGTYCFDLNREDFEEAKVLLSKLREIYQNINEKSVETLYDNRDSKIQNAESGVKNGIGQA